MNWLEKSSNSYNDYYKLYKAEWCKLSKLPMLSRKDWQQIESEDLYTLSRAKKEKIEIDSQKVVAWYRMMNGYAPLFKAKHKAQLQGVLYEK